jgi:phage terminase large subunit
LNTLRIPTAEVFRPLLEPARYKGAWGGRGSGKSHFFGELAIEEALRFPSETGEGLRMICIREVQQDLASSSKQILADKIAKFGLSETDGFKIWKDRIEFPKDGLCIFKGMTDYTAESVKSLEGFKRAWIDEAQSLSKRSLSLLRPTIHRWDGAELWASWNPTRRIDAIDEFFRGGEGAPKGSIVVKANWRNNPFWSDAAEAERQLELERYPERYPHTYEGEYAGAFEGAYFAKLLTQAKLDKRIVPNLSADPLLPLRVFVDIGGAGASADAFTAWVTQWVGDEIRVLNYYEAVGQVLAAHVAWLRQNGCEKAEIYLPHDGVHEQRHRQAIRGSLPGCRVFHDRDPEPGPRRCVDADRGGASSERPSSGSTRPRRKPAAWRWASITSARTTSGTWALGLTTTGRAMARTASA